MSFFHMGLLLWAGAYAYFGVRLIWPARLGLRSKILLGLLLVLLVVIGPAALSLRRQILPSWTTPFMWTAYILIGFTSLLFTFLIIRDAVWLGKSLAAAVVRLYGCLRVKPCTQPGPANPERRRLLVDAMNLGLLGAAGLATGYGVFEAVRTPSIRNVVVPIKNLSPSLSGLKIAQITDLHIGPVIKRAFVEKVVHTVQRAAPDVIVVTGDLVDGSVARLAHDIEPFYDLNAPHGRYFVTGNHEYYAGAGPWINELSRRDFAVLMNEHVLVEKDGGRIALGGVPDDRSWQFYNGQRPDRVRAFERLSEGIPRILLAHRPNFLDENAKLGVDLQISGHTHGGQYFPFNYVARLGYPYVSGLHLHRGMQIYVSRGTGFWGPPVRFSVPSEVTLFTLVRA